jgi:hypothetical protein
MSEDKAKLTGPDLTKGVALSTIREGIMLLLGHAHGEPALLARRGDEVFAIGAAAGATVTSIDGQGVTLKSGSISRPVSSSSGSACDRRSHSSNRPGSPLIAASR